MTKKQYKELVNGLETCKRGDGTEYITRKDGLSADVTTLIRDVVFEIDEHDLDLAYKIVSDALYTMESMDMKEFKECDIYELDGGHASVYNAERLSYLNIWNQDEVSSLISELGGDITEACAYWYDNKVTEALSLFQEAIKA